MTAERVAITGAGGFIGRHLVRHLADQGSEVAAHCGADREVEFVREHASAVFVGDIFDESMFTQLLDGAQTVIHLAGPPSVAESFSAPMECARVHVLGTIGIAGAALQSGASRFVYVSSAEVYGSVSAASVAEAAPLLPRSPYGAAKLAAEHFVRTLCAGRLSAVIVRPFSIYGPGAPSAAVVPTILRQTGRGERIELANLAPVRDFCYIDDVVRGIALAGRQRSQSVEVFNLGSGVGVSVRELAQVALVAVGREMPIVQCAPADRPQSADVDRLVADASRARVQLEWVPEVSLVDGLRRTLCDREYLA